MKRVDEARIEELLSKLTLEEKIGMLHGEGIFQTKGVERLDIPPLKMSDGPMGVRKEFALKDWRNVGTTDDYVSYLPSNSALAATWNCKLAYRMGQVLGAEARGRGKDVILAPGINIKRSPLCGRNFEYMSEDPKLTEEMAVPLIRGIQENDVAACVKHFAANNQETGRMKVNTDMDERTLREIYFPAFRAAVKKAGSISLMGAYNKLYGEFCSQSKFLLTKVLRDEWSYDGAVISDWGAVHDTKCAAESGLDIEMSVGPDFDHYYMADPLIKAVKSGEIKETHIDTKIRNILRMMLRLNMLGEDKKNRKPGAYNLPEHREAALCAARESIILLKNETKRLPIKKDGLKTLAVIGHNAVMQHANGGGSAEIKALYEISPLMGIKVRLGGNIEVKYAQGYFVPEKKEKRLNWQQDSLENDRLSDDKEIHDNRLRERLYEEEQKHRKEQLFTEAVKLAGQSDEVIFIGGLNHEQDVEGRDRMDMKLPYGQEELIHAILDVNPDTVIVLVGGSPVDMHSFKKKAKAILWCWYAGMEGGTALAEVLFGDVNPSGKLPETMPKRLEDSPAHHIGDFGQTDQVTYRDGLYVGYRYYDTYDIEPEFPFGHGLSYTSFEYRKLKVTVAESDKDLCVRAEVTVKNTGAFDGAETIQIYIADRQSAVARPSHELKGFSKLILKAGEEKNTEILLSACDFSFYDAAKKCFTVEPGEYEIQVGSSSRDIRLRGLFNIKKDYDLIEND